MKSKPILWQDILEEEKQQPYFQSILKRIAAEREQGITIYPQNSEIFNALRSTEFEEVKVVIIGQDPYHGPGQAHGLCFSCLLYTSPSPRDKRQSRMPSSA